MIPIQNIYYMLSYAFKILKEKGYAEIATEEFQNTPDMLAEILIKGVRIQLKRGLLRTYNEETETMGCIRGKINITESIKKNTLNDAKLVCTYDVFSVDSYPNRILKTTMLTLMHSNIDKQRKKAIKNLLVYFREVEEIDCRSINWNLKFNRNNQGYTMLISICYLILKELLQTQKDGSLKVMDYFDEQRMCRLYEKFILEYYRAEHPGIASSPQIDWAISEGTDFLLPTMQSDIVLEKGNKVLIIDAKYYAHTTQYYFEKNKIHSANLYQIFTYVKNKVATDPDKEIEGMLLYAKTDEAVQPNSKYVMSGNKISVRTLDLSVDFQQIKDDLDKIAEEFIQIK